jgi:chromosome segregation ATPase
MSLLGNIGDGLALGSFGVDIALKYSKSQYQEKIDRLDSCVQKLEQHLSNLEGYKDQLKTIWDDEYSADYLKNIEKEIKSVKNAQEQANNQIQMWQEAISSMEETVGAQQENIEKMKQALNVLDIVD